MIKLEGVGKFRKGDYFFARDPKDNSTVITLAAPVAGEWKVRVLPGSPPVIRTEEANGYPDASAGAKVFGTGRNRVLHYLYEHEPGQQIQFVERGDKYEQVIGSAAGRPCHPVIPATPAGDRRANPKLTCGTIKFHPAFGPGGTRKIYAVIMNAGEPTNEKLVATYDAPTERPLGAPSGVTVQRNGTTVTVKWNRVPGATSYDVDYTLGDGERNSVDAGGHATSVTLPEVIAPGDSVKVTVAAIRRDDVEGKQSSASASGNGGDAIPEPPST